MIASRLSIRVRFVVPVALMMAAFAIFILSRERSASQESLKQKAESIARLLAFNVSAALVFDDPEPVRAMFEDARGDKDVRHLAVWDADGREFAIDSRDADAPGAPPQVVADFKTRLHEDRVEVTGPIVNPRGGVIGTLQLGLSTARIDKQYEANLWTVILFSLFVAAVTTGIVYWLSKEIAAPMVALAEAARRIATEDMTSLANEAKLMASGDLTREVRLTYEHIRVHSSDEVGQMASSFNLMLDKLGEITEAFNMVSAGLRDLVLHVPGGGR